MGVCRRAENKTEREEGNKRKREEVDLNKNESFIQIRINKGI